MQRHVSTRTRAAAQREELRNCPPLLERRALRASFSTALAVALFRMPAGRPQSSSRRSAAFSPQGRQERRKMPLIASESPQMRHSRAFFLLRPLMNMLKNQKTGNWQLQKKKVRGLKNAIGALRIRRKQQHACCSGGKPEVADVEGDSRYFSEISRFRASVRINCRE